MFQEEDHDKVDEKSSGNAEIETRSTNGKSVDVSVGNVADDNVENDDMNRQISEEFFKKIGYESFVLSSASTVLVSSLFVITPQNVVLKNGSR
jgi:hypothetical protein